MIITDKFISGISKKIKTTLSVIFVAISFLFLQSCGSTKNTSKPRNFDSLYSPKSFSLIPEVQIYSKNKDSSEVGVRIEQQDLLFNQANQENKLLAKVKINYVLYSSHSEQVLDSGNISYSIPRNPEIVYHNLKFTIPAKTNFDYFAEFKISDQNRNLERFVFKNIQRKDKLNQQDFRLLNPESGEFFFDPFIKTDEPFEIKHYYLDIDSLYVFFYKANYSASLPPMQKENSIDSINNPDTMFVFYTDSIVYSNFVTEGIYYFSFSKTPENGFALFNFGYGFPNAVTPCQLFEPINYIANVGHCDDDSTNGRNTKLAVDNFWLSKAKNMNRSRELIKIYYTRVMLANLFFTSYKPGWQSDRGMIYIVYGPPDYLYKSEKEERWIYNPKDLGPGIVFNFEHKPHKFSTNHFELNRTKQKITGWNEAVKMWNTGEVYYYQP